MLLIIIAWVYCFLLSLFLGDGALKLSRKLIGHLTGFGFGIFYRFWFGWCLLLGLLQLLSLFFPLGNGVFLSVSALGLISALINYRGYRDDILRLWRWFWTTKGILSFVGILLLMLIVSYSANVSVTHHDTFLYHFNAVKWAKEYPVVPGLVNLHGRLAFNSSFFLFAAFTEIGPYADNSAHVAVSFLMFVCIIHWLFVISSSREVMRKRIFCMVTFPYLIIHMASRIDIASLSTDYPMAILTLIFCAVLMDNLKHKLLLLLPMSAAVFTIKLSGLLTIGLGMVVLVGTIAFLKQGQRPRQEIRSDTRLMTTSFFLSLFIVLGFIVRNVVLSGWVLYPFPVGNLHLPWSTPKAYVTDMIEWISSYPKIPGGASPSTIKDNTFFYWFAQWFSSFRLTTEFNMLVGAVAILAWSIIQAPSVSRLVYAKPTLSLLLSYAAASLLFWFTSAPDVRFGSIYFYIFLAIAVALLFEGSQYKKTLKLLISTAMVYQIAIQTPGFVLPTEPRLFTFAETRTVELKRVVASPPDEKPALYIYMPVVTGPCGNAPLPCTPYAGGWLDHDRLIRQRVPGDMSKGFLPDIQ